MTMPRNLFFVRHGESEGNVANQKAKTGDLSSFTDEFVTTPGRKWKLTEKGEAQARLAGEWLQKELNRVAVSSDRRNFVSPYVRTRQTAGYLGLQYRGKSVEWFVNRTLRERDWGDIDSIPKKLFLDDPAYKWNSQKEKQDPLYWRPPGGESIQDVAENRVRNFLDTLHRECGDHTVVAVTHGEFMRAARIILERVSDELYDEWENSNEEKIHNCMILQYSKENETSRSQIKIPGTHLQCVRKVYPVVEENRMEIGPWIKLNFTKPTNEDLLSI